MALNPFHLAVPVRDLDEARVFYGNVLGCDEGRSAATWVDFNFYGHQLVCHLAPALKSLRSTKPVDGRDVPVPHFGMVLDLAQWQVLADRLQDLGVPFGIAPGIRFKGQPGEQATMFLFDPSGNALEFKGFRDIQRQLFETG